MEWLSALSSLGHTTLPTLADNWLAESTAELPGERSCDASAMEGGLWGHPRQMSLRPLPAWWLRLAPQLKNSMWTPLCWGHNNYRRAPASLPLSHSPAGDLPAAKEFLLKPQGDLKLLPADLRCYPSVSPCSLCHVTQQLLSWINPCSEGCEGLL